MMPFAMCHVPRHDGSFYEQKQRLRVRGVVQKVQVSMRATARRACLEVLALGRRLHAADAERLAAHRAVTVCGPSAVTFCGIPVLGTRRSSIDRSSGIGSGSGISIGSGNGGIIARNELRSRHLPCTCCCCCCCCGRRHARRA